MQSRTDSFMEAVVNIIIGIVISTIANHFILPAVLGISLGLVQNLVIGAAFTALSLGRSYLIRRMFNGRSVWAAIRGSSPLTDALPRCPVAVAAVAAAGAGE